MTTQAMKSTKLRAAVYLLLALLVLVMTTQVFAQSSTSKPTNEKEFTGVVTAITPTTVTIGTMTFDIAKAEVQATILPGDLVKVHYTVSTDGTLVARELQLAVDVTLEATSEIEDTPEATEVFDDHGHDNPATHVEDQHTGQTEDNHNRGSANTGAPVSSSTPAADDRGNDGSNTQQSPSTPQPHQEDNGGHHSSGGDGGGHGGHGN